jgi:AraC-like DNA-binding protein
MNSIYFQKGQFPDILSFQHISDFFKKKIQNVQPNSYPSKTNCGLSFFYVNEGKFEWILDGQIFLVFPGDLFIVLPNQIFGSPNNIWDVGVFSSISITLDKVFDDTDFTFGDWSGLPITEQKLIGKLFFLNPKPVIQNFRIFGEVFSKIQQELSICEIGFKTRVNQLLDELILCTVRQLSKQDNLRRDFPQTFQKFDKILRENISHPWTVEEMAVIMGLGTTAFTEKVKSYSGFSPLNYLINLRIAESIKLLKNTTISLTDIALDTGFYSSQHFSSTFKKLTGYTPGYYRKNN